MELGLMAAWPMHREADAGFCSAARAIRVAESRPWRTDMRCQATNRTSPSPPRKPAAEAVPPPPTTAARWKPVVDDRRCSQSVSNLNPAGARDRLLVPCDRPASKTCPTCGHRYCARHFEGWHWIRDKDAPRLPRLVRRHRPCRRRRGGQHEPDNSVLVHHP